MIFNVDWGGLFALRKAKRGLGRWKEMDVAVMWKTRLNEESGLTGGTEVCCMSGRGEQ